MVPGQHDRTSPYAIMYTSAGAVRSVLHEALATRIADLPNGIRLPRFLPDAAASNSNTTAAWLAGTVEDGVTIRQGRYVVLRKRLHRGSAEMEHLTSARRVDSMREPMPLCAASWRTIGLRPQRHGICAHRIRLPSVQFAWLTEFAPPSQRRPRVPKAA